MDWNESYPGIELLGQANQVFGLGEKGLDQYPEETYEYGKLNNQGAKAANWANSRLPIQLHGFLGDASPVAAVALLDFPHSRLKLTHPPHLANLLQGKGQCYQPYQDGEGDYGQPHIVEANHVQHHQGVEHGADYDFIPEEEKELQGDS